MSSLGRACASRPAPQFISQPWQGWVLPCWGYTFTQPGSPRHSNASTACTSQSSLADNSATPLSAARGEVLSACSGTLLTHCHPTVLSRCPVLHAPAKEFCSLSSSTSGFAGLCKHISQRTNPRACRGRGKYALNTFSENYLNTSSIK